MQVVILCGGRGTRLREYAKVPKPLVPVGNLPIVWHVMQLYAAAGIDEFILCLGHRSDEIRRFFAGRHRRARKGDGTPCAIVRTEEGWTVSLIDTGEETQTGGRLRRVSRYVDGETFLATYADCVADVDVGALLAFHANAMTIGTITVVKPPPRFGVVSLEGDRVVVFAEKRPEDEPWINGGFFVFDRRLFDLIADDQVVLERGPLPELAEAGQLSAFVHEGFWQCIDTPADVAKLEALWADGMRPWVRCGLDRSNSVVAGVRDAR